MTRIYAFALLGILCLSFFSTSALEVKTQNATQAPPYVFEGAYANYQFALNYSLVSLTEEIDYLVTGVNNTTQTFDVNMSTSLNVNGIISSTSINQTASFSQPSPFPAVDYADLNNLTNGSVPENILGTYVNITGASITPNVAITVPAGSYKTYEITVTNYTNEETILGNSTSLNVTTWIDSYSGMVVEASVSILSGNIAIPPITLELVKTNIPSSPSAGGYASPLSLELVAVIIVVVILAAAAVGFLFLRSRKGGKIGGDMSPSPPEPPTAPPTSPQAS